MQTVKKALKKALNIISWILVVLAVFMIIFTVMSSIMLEKEERNLFGVRAYAVLSDSMSKTDFDAGDIVFVKVVDPATLEVGDIISYKSAEADTHGEIITHKIRELTVDEAGNPVFITYGTTTNVNDEQPVSYSQVVGKMLFSVPNVGEFFAFIKTPTGYILIIFLPIAILLLLQALNSFRLYKLYKAGESAEVKSAKAEREKQTEQNKELMEELRKTKELLEKELGNIHKEEKGP